MSAYIPKGAGDRHQTLLYVASPGDTEDSIWNFLRSYPFTEDSTARFIVYPRGIGTSMWDAMQRRRFERCSMLLGRTVDDMRLYDVLCAIDYIAMLPSFDGRSFTVVGRGMQGILGAYAALLDKRVSRVILHTPTTTHKTSPIFLNILRYTDIPQTLAMLAPRELVFLTQDIGSFEYTRSIYKLYNAEHAFRRAQVFNSKR
ncbi:hypothetical protein ACFL60_02670 [Candidatus Omnitrophota bacterium]